MILYNVTLNIDPEIKDEWLIWMKETHLPEVMATGKFTSFEMYKIHNHNENDTSLNYSVQYYAQSILDYEDYMKNFAPDLRKKTESKYMDKVIAFRTILESVL